MAVEGPGVVTTIPLLLAHPRFAAGEHTTRFVDDLMADREPQPTA